MTEASFADMCDQLAGNAWLLGLVITLGVCFLEDPARCAVGLLVATGHIGWWLAFVSMMIGSVIGDVGLYLIGRYAMVFCINRRWVNVDRLEQMKGYFAQHAIKSILAARFFPGARTLAYVSAGAIHYRVVRFLIILTVAALVQALLFLYATDLIGEQVLAYLEKPATRWVAAGIVLFVMVAVHFIVKHRKKYLQKA